MSWVDDEGNVSDEIVPLAIIDGGVIHWLDEEEHALHDAGKLPYRFVEYHAGDLDLERWWNKLARTVAVDFDGVLHPYTDGWKGSVPVDEPPVPGAKEFLQWCVQQRYEVVVFSTRADHAEGLAGILAWLLKYGLLEYVEGGVTHTKPPAIAYVDDRAVPYAGDWEAVRQGVKVLTLGNWVKVLTLGNSHGPAT